MLKFNTILPRILLMVQRVPYGKQLTMVGWPFIFRFPRAEITIGRQVTINSSFWSNFLGLYQRTIIVAKGNGKIHIGNKVGMSGCTIYAWDSIDIGDYTIIGANVKIVDNDFHPISPEERRTDDYSHVAHRPVKIGQNVFVGMNTLILKGTEIGDNCVIGAGSVVCGKFPENCVIAGNPARVIKNIVSDTERENA